PGPGPRSRRRASHRGESPPARLLAQHSLVLPPGSDGDAVVSRPGIEAARRPLRGTGAECRSDPAGRTGAPVVDRPRKDGGFVCRVSAEGCGRLAPVGGGVSAHRGAGPASRGASTAAAVRAPARDPRPVRAGAPTTRGGRAVPARVRDGGVRA